MHLEKSMNQFFQACIRQASLPILKKLGEDFDTFLYYYFDKREYIKLF